MRKRRGGERRHEDDEDSVLQANQEGVRQKMDKRKQTCAFMRVKKKNTEATALSLTPLSTPPPFLSSLLSLSLLLSWERGLAGLGLNAICCIM